MSTLAFTISIDGVDDDSLVVRAFDGHECLSHESHFGVEVHGFEYTIDLASRREDLSPDDMVDQRAELTIYRDGEAVQCVHGIVRAFTQGNIGHNHTFYSLTLVPSLARLSLYQDRRVFQDKDASEVISILLEEVGIRDFAFALTRTLTKREYCVQGRETNLAFLERLAAEEGMVYYVEHIAGKHTIVFSDRSVTFEKLINAVPFNATAGGVADSPFIKALDVRTQSEVAEVKLRDRSFKNPSYNLESEAFGRKLDYQRGDYTHFDFPGRYKDDEMGKVYSGLRLEYLRRQAQTAHGKGNEPLLRPGYRFTLQGHINPDCNQDWSIVAVRHVGKQPQALEEDGGSGATTYHNTFVLIPATTTWRATPELKPLMPGPEIATVVGPGDEEIYCDEYGRVRIQFPWDRYTPNDDTASCWVRVSHSQAGSQYGMMSLPRVGEEVVVSFINGDPDQPMVTGRAYNDIHKTPYPLPANKTKTVWRSQTHQGSGFNELSFEDQSGKEKLYLRAQKDLEMDVQNDRVTTVKNNEHLIIDNDSHTHIKNTQHVKIDGASNTQVTGDHSLTVEGSMHHSATQSYALQASEDIHIKAGQNLVLEADAAITIKVGGNHVTINVADLILNGQTVKVNAGGSAGSGKGASATLPSLPLGLASPVAPEKSLPTYIAAQLITQDALVQIATNNSGLTALCGEQPDGTCSRGSECPCKQGGRS